MTIISKSILTIFFLTLIFTTPFAPTPRPSKKVPKLKFLKTLEMNKKVNFIII